MSKVAFPDKKSLKDATIEALKLEGGKGTTTKINAKVAEILNLDEDILSIEDSTGCGTKYMERMRWCRTELKKEQLIENVGKGIWKLT